MNLYLSLQHEIVCSSFIGTDTMASKSKKQAIIFKKSNKTKPQLQKNGLPLARRCVSQRASTPYQKCPMQLVIFLSLSDHWYLHSHSSNLLHKNHKINDLSGAIADDSNCKSNIRRRAANTSRK